MKLEDLKYNRENTCPLCGTPNVKYKDTETGADCIWYECTCEDCGATWEEVYKMSFLQVDEVYNNAGEKIYSSFDN